jgi:hypothetical protein
MIINESSETEIQEISHLFLSFCTFTSLTQGKKLNTANVFLLLLKNKHLRSIFKRRMEIDNDYEAVSLFLRFDPSLYKSKYIMKYLNKAGENKIKR